MSLTQPAFPFSAPAVDDGSVYVSDHQGDLHSVRVSTGATDWLYALNERVVRSSPVIVGDVVLLGLADGSLGVVDRTSGHLVWRSRPTAGRGGSRSRQRVGASSSRPVVAAPSGSPIGCPHFRRTM